MPIQGYKKYYQDKYNEGNKLENQLAFNRSLISLSKHIPPFVKNKRDVKKRILSHLIPIAN